jgi:hypothetical protein
MSGVSARLLCLSVALLGGAWAASAETRTFTSSRVGEAVAVVRAQSPGCDWGRAGAEASVVRIDLDGRYSQHLPLVRGGEEADYRIALGRVAPGAHQLQIVRDERLSAAPCGAELADVSVEVVDEASEDHLAAAFAPVLHARPDTVGRFTDTPILMYVEVSEAADGVEYRYTVIFTNEDGGTPADQLMATWGRATDIEFVYGVRTDRSGRVLFEEIQATGHELVAFTGRHEARHPLLWVATDNNMVEPSGPTEVRMAPAVERVDLGGRARETAMDRHPWTYRVMADELAREGKVDPAAAPGSGRIPDIRSFLFVEACVTVRDSAVALSLGLDDGAGGTAWFDVDRGVREFRLTRSGCSRVAVPVSRAAPRIVAMRARALEQAKRVAAPSAATIQELSAFALDERYRPSRLPQAWRGDRALDLGGSWQIFTFER